MRASTSVEPPAGYGTMILTGWSGQLVACAKTTVAVAAVPRISARRLIRWRLLIMDPDPCCRWSGEPNASAAGRQRLAAGNAACSCNLSVLPGHPAHQLLWAQQDGRRGNKDQGESHDVGERGTLAQQQHGGYDANNRRAQDAERRNRGRQPAHDVEPQKVRNPGADDAS